MSIWGEFKTFFEKIGSDLKKIFGSTTWEQKALTTIAVAEPFIDGIVELVDPPLLPIVTVVQNAVTADLTTIKTVIQQGTVAPGSSEASKVVAALNSVKVNLSSLLADADIKNSAKISKITAAVNLVNGEVDAILGEVPAAPTSVSA